MNNLKLNETPVRTSRNFNINNIKLENIDMPNEINEFSNLTITGENVKIDNNNNSNINLAYGLGEILTEQVKNQSNQKLKLSIDSKENEETQIELKFDNENANLVENIEIIANENTKSTIIIKYLSNENVQAYHNGIIRVSAKKSSNISIIIVNLMNSQSNNFLAIQNELENDSNVKYTVIDLGGKNSITNYYSNLIGEKTNNTINTIYLGKEDQLFDLNYIAELRGEKTNIDIEVQGALKEKSKKHFQQERLVKKSCFTL